MCVQDMKFSWSNLWPGGLSTDADANNDNDDDNTQETIHDFIGFVGIYAKWTNDPN